MRRMSRLSAAFTFGFLLLVFGSARWIGGRRRGGIGGVGFEACLQVGELLLQQSNLPLQLGNASITLLATRAWQHIHVAILEKESSISCASFKKNAERLRRIFERG